MTATPSDTAADDSEATTVGARDTIMAVTEGLTYCIRAGQLVPGQHLVEADLTQRFGVSRGSLREGLKQLNADGIVTLSRFRGAFIAALDRKGVSDLLDVLEPLCTLAARLAALHCHDAQAHAALREEAQTLVRHSETGGRAAYLESRRRFYDHLIEMGGNSELGRVIPLARTDLFRAQFSTVQTKEQHRRHARGYIKIAEAVAENDAGKAERAVRKHFAGTRATLDLLAESAFAVAGRG
ncbi:GntR family transcriptional regulator [Novosphingobium rosa]|uniref:GntR family transcriptional regulator n=1 Tax=Novosphingobium rosa TaxID=76978 RepID=UPI001471E075|nr:GntR family transcriptional regulator [Novosphingobium rosa]